MRYRPSGANKPDGPADFPPTTFRFPLPDFRFPTFRFSSGAPSPPAPIPERRPACVKFGYKISLKNQANRPQRPWMLRSALSKQEKSVDNLPAIHTKIRQERRKKSPRGAGGKAGAATDAGRARPVAFGGPGPRYARALTSST